MKRITESKLNSIIKSVINEISGSQGMPTINRDRSQEVIEMIKSEGYECQTNGKALIIKFTGSNKGNTWGLTQSEAMNFYNLVSKVIDYGWKLVNMAPSNGCVIFYFLKGNMRYDMH
jgi:hypothetical protein